MLLDSLERNLERYLQTRLSGFVLLGSNGESAHLAEEEKLQILARASALVPPDRYLMAGVGFPSLRQSLAFIEKLEAFRLDALLISVPSYYKNRMNARALYEYFSSLADRSPFPLLLYNVPQYSGLELVPEMISDLAGHANIVGMKESSGNLLYLQRVLELTRDRDFQILLGSAQILGPCLVLGVRAAIVAVACALPELPIQLMLDFEKGKDVSQEQARIYEVSMALTARLGVPGLKYAMDCLGYEGRCCRRPLLPLTPEEKSELERVLRPYTEALPTR